ncbi:MAG TPA: ABC-F family ATP-binding cassette domain-containing protein [Candidatus Limnocylindrales bacterium]|nr:ABC-F family ATP-binding cassette domain-containing protein [Candidatus Limnocylindrales bacterium]
MAIVRLEEVRREIGAQVILDSITAAIARGEKVGLVGANGAGKTTLLRLVAGIDDPDTGRVHRASGLRLELLAQETNLDPTFMAAPTLRDAVRSGAGELLGLEQRLRQLEAMGAVGVETAEYARLHDQFEVRGGYTLDVRVDSALSGLGFDREDWGRPPTQMSGGQQTRAALARALVSELDLLMLDEPTNHLDVTAIEWLEKTLSDRPGALLVAAHDRAFLDAVVGRIWEIREHRLEAFRGNYSAYAVQREERDARARLNAENLTGGIARERELVQTYRSHRKFAKMHEHERRLAALQDQASVSAAPQGRRTTRIALDGNGRAPVVRSGDVAVDLEDLTVGFPSVPIAVARRLEARRGDKIGVVGPNGAGKTTLLRTLAGDLAPLGGLMRMGQGVHIGYLAQVRARPLPGATVLDAFAGATGLDSGPARTYLARFLFRGDDVQKPVEKLSGGERSRLELAIVGVAGSNLLLLDEPTNHLDIPAREALETFLRETAATAIVVSHDRRLLEGVCNQLWVVEQTAASGPAQIGRFPGGYREWRAAVGSGWSVESALANAPLIPRTAPAASLPKPKLRTKPTSARQTLSKDAYRRRRQVVEDDLTRLGLRKSQLELALNDSGIQQNFVELRRVTSELADVDAALALAEDAWLVLAEQAPR